MAEEVIVVGVPEIAPVEESSARPAGSDGHTNQPRVRPSSAADVTVVMAVSFVSVKEFGLYVSEDGTTSLTSMVTSAVVLPPVLLAVTV